MADPLLPVAVDLVKEVASKYGPFGGLFLLLAAWHDRSIRALYEKLLRSKDDEIERLVSERNKLQSVVLKDRKSSKH